MQRLLRATIAHISRAARVALRRRALALRIAAAASGRELEFHDVRAHVAEHRADLGRGEECRQVEHAQAVECTRRGAHGERGLLRAHRHRAEARARRRPARSRRVGAWKSAGETLLRVPVDDQPVPIALDIELAREELPAQRIVEERTQCGFARDLAAGHAGGTRDPCRSGARPTREPSVSSSARRRPASNSARTRALSSPWHWKWRVNAASSSKAISGGRRSRSTPARDRRRRAAKRGRSASMRTATTVCARRRSCLSAGPSTKMYPKAQRPLPRADVLEAANAAVAEERQRRKGFGRDAIVIRVELEPGAQRSVGERLAASAREAASECDHQDGRRREPGDQHGTDSQELSSVARVRGRYDGSSRADAPS